MLFIYRTKSFKKKEEEEEESKEMYFIAYLFSSFVLCDESSGSVMITLKHFLFFSPFSWFIDVLLVQMIKSRFKHALSHY